MLKLFVEYTSIGVLNILIHRVVFGVCTCTAHTNQALASFAGLVVVVSLSFFADVRFTFKTSATTVRYMLYVGSVETLSATIGRTTDKRLLPPIITLITFSTVNLVCGFAYLESIIFRDTK